MNRSFLTPLCLAFLCLSTLFWMGCQPQHSSSDLAAVVANPEALLDRKPVAQLNLKAQQLLENGQPEAAIARLESALDLSANEPATLYNLAIAYEKAGYPLKSARTFEQLLALNPQQGSRLNPAEIHKSLGVLYEVIAESYLSGSPPEAEHPDAFDEAVTAAAAESQKKAKPNVPEAEKAYRIAMNHYQKAIEAGSPESEPIHQQILDIQAQLQKGLKAPLQ